MRKGSVTPSQLDLHIPTSWFKGAVGSSVWISVFQVITPEAPPEKPLVLQLDRSVVQIVAGGFSYFDSGHGEWSVSVKNGIVQLKTPRIEQRVAPDGSYVALVLPYDTDGHPGDETRTRREADAIVGLLAAFNRLNMVFRQLFENIFRLDTGETTGFSSSIVNPMAFGEPNLCPTRFELIRDACQAISTLADADRTRTKLSLHWFSQAVHDSGLDAFLKLWIALECLGMPDSSNVRPLVQGLARIYGCSEQEGRQKFAIGKMQGIRSEIVHAGRPVLFTGPFLDYIEAVYVDLLFHHLGLPTERRAEKALAGTSVDHILPRL